MAFITQGVFFALAQLISASSASSPTVPKEPRSLSLTASSTSSLTVAKEPRSLSLSKGPLPNRIFLPSLTHPALKDVCDF